MSQPYLSGDTYWATPRVGGLVLSPDGSRLVLAGLAPSVTGKDLVSTLWSLPVDGSAPAKKLTSSRCREWSPAFLPDGTLAFASLRPDPDAAGRDTVGLFAHAIGEDEPRRLFTAPGGIGMVRSASAAPVAIVSVPMLPESADLDDDAARYQQRTDRRETGVLLRGFPIRHFDHEIGPRTERLFKVTMNGGTARLEALTEDAGIALHACPFAVSPDGSTVVSTWRRNVGRPVVVADLVSITGGEVRTLATGGDLNSPAISPSGHGVVASWEKEASPRYAQDGTLWLVDLVTGAGRDVLAGFDLWPRAPIWSADGAAVWFTAEQVGQTPVFRVDTASGDVETLVDDAAYSSLQPSPDGRYLYALRSSLGAPPHVVRIDVATAEVVELPTPGLPVQLPGRVEEVRAQATDGAVLRGWLVVPVDRPPGQRLPLVVWIHGGPLYSWTAWSWAWCPHLLADAGYAVLLPDPALSLGYGHDFIARGWGKWGEPVWGDVEAILDAAVTRDDIDREQLAAIGNSFGGYLVNWIAGHSDRFRALISVAGQWNLEAFQATTDYPHWTTHQFGDPREEHERYAAASPDTASADMHTPMLLTHGLRDYRVPISESLRAYTDLTRNDVDVRLLLFPDEGHVLSRPPNARQWYDTVIAFLDEHLTMER